MLIDGRYSWEALMAEYAKRSKKTRNYKVRNVGIQLVDLTTTWRMYGEAGSREVRI
jgi:hypothetical protein